MPVRIRVGMGMEPNHQKASAFVYRLLSNPALTNYTPLQKEEQVSQFLLGNIDQLGPTLMSPAFFPSSTPEQIMALLQATLRQLTDERLIPALKTVVQKIDFSFIQSLRHQQIRPSNIQDQVLRVLHQYLTKPVFRQAFAGAYTALHYNFASRYLNETYKMRRHVYFDLTKVQRLQMSKDAVKSFVEVTILLKAIAQTMVSEKAAEVIDIRSGLVNSSIVGTLFDLLKTELTHLPQQVLTSIVNSNVSFLESPQMETTARLASVMVARGKAFVSDIRVDRGADTPDKSWLNIARRNYKFYGFDIKMLDEMYMIAAENGW